MTHKVAGGTKLLIVGICIDMRAKELVRALDEEGTLPIREDVIAVDPSSRLLRCLLVMGICCIDEGTGSLEIRETK